MFSPEQIMAMLLTKLKTISEKELSTKVTDCVVSVSTYVVLNFFCFVKLRFNKKYYIIVHLQTSKMKLK